MSQSKVANKIRYHAYKARKIAEQVAKEEGIADDLYGFATRSSVILWEELNRVGLKAKIVYNPGHVFVYCEGWHVDITATQFGLGKTFVRNINSVDKLSQKEFHRYGEKLFPDWHLAFAWETFSNPISLQAWQYSNGQRNEKDTVKTEDLMRIAKIFKPNRIIEVASFASNDFLEDI